MNLDAEIKRDSSRVARLFMQLPIESRTMIAYNPARDWSWDKETQSRILAKLDHIYVLLGNAFRDKKKSSKIKPEPQWQPDYAKEAKEEAQARQNARRRLTDEEKKALQAFWQKKNYNSIFLED